MARMPNEDFKENIMQTMVGFGRNAGNQYREQSILTASPGELVVMLYDGCIKQVRLARLAIQENDIEQSSQYLIKAQDIIDGLIKGLDFNYPISKDLMNLYEFILREMIDCNISKDVGKLDGIEPILVDMKTTWETVVHQCRMEQYSMAR